MQRLTRNQARAGSAVRQLVTLQEEQIIEVQSHLSASQNRAPTNQLRTEQIDEEQDQEVSIERLKQADVEKMAILINQLIAKNKINAKNAFEIPIIHLQDTKEFKSGFGENSWKNLSSTLQNDYKIYGYRVDATHNYTYSMLQSITRQEKKDEDFEEKKDSQYMKKDKNDLNCQFISGNIEDYYCKYLERNYRNINIMHLQTFFDTNPIIEKTKRIFDQHGIKGLLLNNIEINCCLELTINDGLSINRAQQEAAPQNINEILIEMNFANSIQDYNIFKKIQQNCRSNLQADQQEEEEDGPLLKRQSNEIEQLWNQYNDYAQGRKIQAKKQQSEMIKYQQSSEEPFSCGEQQLRQSKEMFFNLDAQVLPSTQSNTIAVNIPIQSQKETPKSPIQSSEVHINPLISDANSEDRRSMMPQPITDIQKPRSQIASFIRMKRNSLSLSTDIVLKQITDFEADEPHEQVNLVNRWKRSDKRQVIRRLKKQKSPIVQYVQFLDNRKQRSRSSIFSIDKSKRKEVKKLMKPLHLEDCSDLNAVIDTSRWKIDLKTMTSLRQHTIGTIVIDNTEGQQIQKKAETNQINLDCVIDLTAPISLSDGQVDCYRKNMNVSIRKAKDLVRDIMFAQQQQMTFLDVYEKLIKIEGCISAALCFLTVLHLTNQYGFILQNCQDQHNFVIKRQ